jgi:hypothetical protein
VEEQRRRLDMVLDGEFVEDLDSLSGSDLRERRQIAADIESELSFYRRLLHGRMDLLNFELARRRGEEKRSLIEALPQILGAGETAGGQTGRVRSEYVPELVGEGNRSIDTVLADDFLTRMPDMDVTELESTQGTLAEAEERISDRRRVAQDRFDKLQEKITGLYRDQIDKLDPES